MILLKVSGLAKSVYYYTLSKIDKDELERMMLKSDELLNDMGTILIGQQAVECGLIDNVGGIKDALDKLDELIRNNQEKDK